MLAVHRQVSQDSDHLCYSVDGPPTTASSVGVGASGVGGQSRSFAIKASSDQQASLSRCPVPASYQGQFCGVVAGEFMTFGNGGRTRQEAADVEAVRWPWASYEDSKAGFEGLVESGNRC